jgi:hypothetical protein
MEDMINFTSYKRKKGHVKKKPFHKSITVPCPLTSISKFSANPPLIGTASESLCYAKAEANMRKAKEKMRRLRKESRGLG